MSERRSPPVRWRMFVRLGRVCLGDGFTAARQRMVNATILTVVASGVVPAYPLGYRLLADGTRTDSPFETVVGALIVAILVTAAWSLAALASTDAADLVQQVAVLRSARLTQTVGGIAGLEHLSPTKRQDEVARAVTERRLLSAGPQTALDAGANVARIVVLLVLLAAVSPVMLLAPLCAIPPLVCGHLAGVRSERASEQAVVYRRRSDLIFRTMTDEPGARELRVYGLSDLLGREHRRLRAEGDRIVARAERQAFVVSSVGWVAFAAGLCGLMVIVVDQAQNGSISAGTSLMALLLIQRARTQLSSATRSGGALSRVSAAARRLFALDDFAAECAVDATGAAAPRRIEHGIRLSDVSFGYEGRTDRALSGVDAWLPAGSVVALVGANGSGKSTLVALLLGLHPPTSGTVAVDDVTMSGIDRSEWYRRCTATFQDFSRFELTLVEAVDLATEPAPRDPAEVRDALDRATAGFLHELGEGGLDTPLGAARTGGRGLSDGQWQQVAIARALRRRSALLTVLDEPTANVDARRERTLLTGIMDASRRVAQRTGGITVIVTHRAETAARADLVLYLESSRIVETGSHVELQAAGGRYARFLEAGRPDPYVAAGTGSAVVSADAPSV